MVVKRRTRKYPATRMVVLGFLCAIIIGTVLLCLPISSKSGEGLALEDALFMSTTSICVTGLTTVSVAQDLSFFGQLIVLLFMQFGGLGVVTFTTATMFIIGKRITLKERMMIQDAYNLDTLGGLVRMTKRIIKGTLIVEGFGAVVYAFCFLPGMLASDLPLAESILQGIWQSVFQAVSAFCNAGMDLLGTSSMAAFRDHTVVNLNTMMLIVFGGIGFPVWWNLLEVLPLLRREEYTTAQIKRKITLHTRVALITTAVLLVSGTLITLLFEWGNPETLGNLNVFQKIQAAAFQSVTTRTAGFYTIPQENFTPASSIVYLLLMFIGGSPSGTAGGIKTVTFALLLISTVSIMKGKTDIEIFRRRINERYLRKALTVVIISASVLFVATVALAVTQQSDFLDTIYETTSAIATVGLTRNFTGTLDTVGKLIITACMYLGRVGPISMALAFNMTHIGTGRTLPEGKLTVG